ncbi:DNA alkylation repair protein, partial [bacterium]|nr:DNA alkylation repair protein [bacterium]
MKKIDLELKELSANPQNIKDYSRFHKDGKQRLGIAASIIRKLSSRYFKEIKHEEKQLILSLCTRMLDAGKSSYMEIAFDWAFRLEKHYQSEDFEIFESWLENHVDNWGSCDDLCTHAFGAFLFRFPEFLPRAEQWTKSTSKWVRRASAVVLIFSLRRMKHLKEALKVAENLLSDSE